MELVWQDDPHIHLDPQSEITHILPRKTHKAHARPHTLFLLNKASVQLETAVMPDKTMLHIIEFTDKRFSFFFLFSQGRRLLFSVTVIDYSAVQQLEPVAAPEEAEKAQQIQH